MSGISLNNTYFGLTASGASSLFGSLGTGSSTSQTSLLSDYASIRNGSYTKLLRSYYTGTEKKAASTSKTDDKTDSAKQLVSTRDDAKSLKSAADKLLDSGKDSLFKDKDMDGIYSAVSDFVKNYNNLIDDAKDSSKTSVLNSASNMVSLTKVMSNALSKVGITVGSDNKLSINEDSFKKADFSNVKSLFNGTGSYAYQISSSASAIANTANSSVAGLYGSIYNGDGGYGSNYAYSGSLYTSIF